MTISSSSSCVSTTKRLLYAVTRIILWIVLLVIPIFIGWLNTFDIPMGVLSCLLYPISKGYFVVPSILLSSGKKGYDPCPVPEIPSKDMMLLPYPIPENVSYVTLPNDGKTLLPHIGIGMCCRYTAYDYESVKRTVLWYLLLGGRHVDTAQFYLNHVPIGDAISIAINEYNIPRDEIFITTKVFAGSYGYNTTLHTIQQFLHELQVDYIDLVLLHTPSITIGGTVRVLAWGNECTRNGLSHKECRIDTWKALNVAKNQHGSIRTIGVSNFLIHHIQELQELAEKSQDGSISSVAVNQIPYNPWIHKIWQDVHEYCHLHNITVVAYSSFMGAAMKQHQLLSSRIIQTIATNKSHDDDNGSSWSTAQVLLRWSIQKGNVVIPGTSNPIHIQENLNVYNLRLSDKEMELIDSILLSDDDNDNNREPKYIGMIPDKS